MVFGSRKRKQTTVQVQTKKVKTRLQKLKPVLGAAGVAALGAIALKFGGGSVMELISYAEAYGMKKSFEKLLEKNKKNSEKITDSDIASVTKYFAGEVEFINIRSIANKKSGLSKSRENFVNDLLQCGFEKVSKCTMDELVLSIPVKGTNTASVVTNKVFAQFKWVNTQMNTLQNDRLCKNNEVVKEFRILLKLFYTRGKISGFSIRMLGDAARTSPLSR